METLELKTEKQITNNYKNYIVTSQNEFFANKIPTMSLKEFKKVAKK